MGGCHWVYTVKFYPDSSVYTFEVCLVAEGFSQTYGAEYFVTLSHCSLNFICISLFSCQFGVAHLSIEYQKYFSLWWSTQGNLYQSPRYVAHRENIVWKLSPYCLQQTLRVFFAKFSTVIARIDFQMCRYNHSIFVRHMTSGLLFSLSM